MPDVHTQSGSPSSSIPNPPYNAYSPLQMDPTSRQTPPAKEWTEPKAYQPVTGAREVESLEGYQNNPEAPWQQIPPIIVAHHRRRLFWWFLRYLFIAVVIFVALLIPTIVLSNEAEFADDSTIESIESRQYQNLVFYLCYWLIVTWAAAVLSDLLGLSLPYSFRFIARYGPSLFLRQCFAHSFRYVNSSHQKYWRVFKFLRRPITFLVTTIITYIFFAAVCTRKRYMAART